MFKLGKVFVAGHKGMVGSAINRRLNMDDVEADIVYASRKDLDCESQSSVYNFLEQQKVQAVIIAAAKVGGINANVKYPAQFIKNNLNIAINLIDASYKSGVKKVLFLGSSCIYPKFASQPINEESLLTGSLESTNESYAIAKIAGVKMCEAYYKEYQMDCRAIMPTNLYGINDNYDSEDSHVIPGLVSKFHYAKVNKQKNINIWGSGLPKREFLYADDLADACVNILNLTENEYSNLMKGPKRHINVGFGNDIEIRTLAYKIADLVNYKGKINFDTSFPDGTPQKLLNNTLINSIGWYPNTSLDKGLLIVYQDFLKKLQE